MSSVQVTGQQDTEIRVIKCLFVTNRRYAKNNWRVTFRVVLHAGKCSKALFLQSSRSHIAKLVLPHSPLDYLLREELVNELHIVRLEVVHAW